VTPRTRCKAALSGRPALWADQAASGSNVVLRAVRATAARKATARLMGIEQLPVLQQLNRRRLRRLSPSERGRPSGRTTCSAGKGRRSARAAAGWRQARQHAQSGDSSCRFGSCPIEASPPRQGQACRARACDPSVRREGAITVSPWPSLHRCGSSPGL